MYITWNDVIIAFVFLILQAIFLFSNISDGVGLFIHALSTFLIAYCVSDLITRYLVIRRIRKIRESMSDEYKERLKKTYEEFLKKHPSMRKKESDEDNQN